MMKFSSLALKRVFLLQMLSMALRIRLRCSFPFPQVGNNLQLCFLTEQYDPSHCEKTHLHSILQVSTSTAACKDEY